MSKIRQDSTQSGDGKHIPPMSGTFGMVWLMTLADQPSSTQASGDVASPSPTNVVGGGYPVGMVARYGNKVEINVHADLVHMKHHES